MDQLDESLAVVEVKVMKQWYMLYFCYIHNIVDNAVIGLNYINTMQLW